MDERTRIVLWKSLVAVMVIAGAVGLIVGLWNTLSSLTYNLGTSYYSKKMEYYPWVSLLFGGLSWLVSWIVIGFMLKSKGWSLSKLTGPHWFVIFQLILGCALLFGCIQGEYYDYFDGYSSVSNSGTPQYHFSPLWEFGLIAISAWPLVWLLVGIAIIRGESLPGDNKVGKGLKTLGMATLLTPFGLWHCHMSLITQRNLCEESWSNIETEMRRREDLIAKLENVVMEYAQHEKGVHAQIAEIRSSVGYASVIIVGVVERYPGLTANENFLHLQAELVTTENRIQSRRLEYNKNVKNLNDLVDCIPSSMVAYAFGIKRRKYFQEEANG